METVSILIWINITTFDVRIDRKPLIRYKTAKHCGITQLFQADIILPRTVYFVHSEMVQFF